MRAGISIAKCRHRQYEGWIEDCWVLKVVTDRLSLVEAESEWHCS